MTRAGYWSRVRRATSSESISTNSMPRVSSASHAQRALCSTTSPHRRTLDEELGIAPGERLEELHRRILEQDPTLASRRPSTARTAPALEERKVVTVLFADLANFTASAELLDPEDIRAFVMPYYGHI